MGKTKYYLDTEFHEFKKKGINTIELISIGLCSEDDREYYAICNEFDIKAAWNNKWLKENVLFHIWFENYNLLNHKEKLTKGIIIQNYNPYEGEKPLKILSYVKGKLRVFNPNMDAETYIDDLSAYYILNDFNLENLTQIIIYKGKSKYDITREIYEFTVLPN